MVRTRPKKKRPTHSEGTAREGNPLGRRSNGDGHGCEGDAERLHGMLVRSKGQNGTGLDAKKK